MSSVLHGCSYQLYKITMPLFTSVRTLLCHIWMSFWIALCLCQWNWYLSSGQRVDLPKLCKLSIFHFPCLSLLQIKDLTFCLLFVWTTSSGQNWLWFLHLGVISGLLRDHMWCREPNYVCYMQGKCLVFGLSHQEFSIMRQPKWLFLTTLDS